MDTPGIKFNSGKVARLLKQIFDGEITEKNLPNDLYLQISEYLKAGLYKGFGSDNFLESELLSDLRDNVYLFSSAKTYHFTKACSELLVDESGQIKPFNKFYAEGQELYGTYMESYAKAEYVTVIGQAQMAKQWQSIEANKDILPLLTFSTNGLPCPECAPFEGLTAPVNSSIWNKCLPLLHFQCHCIIIPSDDEKLSTQEFINALPIEENIPKDFQNNPGKTGEIFTKNNPYFTEAPKKLAANNFGMSVPNEDKKNVA